MPTTIIMTHKKGGGGMGDFFRGLLSFYVYCKEKGFSF